MEKNEGNDDGFQLMKRVAEWKVGRDSCVGPVRDASEVL